MSLLCRLLVPTAMASSTPSPPLISDFFISSFFPPPPLPKPASFFPQPRRPSTGAPSLSSSFSKLSLTSQVVCRSTYNVQVIVSETEPEERLVNRFRREVLRAGIIQESKRRRFFENSQEKKKRKKRDAAKRNRKRRPPPPRKLNGVVGEEGKKTKKNDGYDETEDNWELPGDIP
uniref:Ribosomal protein S21 n=1 Tax=Kalanchoe fedtschenkoi TaxID=63787 RepID=A0A7N0TJ32_KALFE